MATFVCESDGKRLFMLDKNGVSIDDEKGTDGGFLV